MGEGEGRLRFVGGEIRAEAGPDTERRIDRGGEGTCFLSDEARCNSPSSADLTSIVGGRKWAERRLDRGRSIDGTLPLKE
jgi:hypothetical protein